MTPLKRNSPAPIHQRNLFLFFSLFMLAGALISSVMMVYYRSEINTRLARLEVQEAFSINLQSKAVAHLFDAIVGDLFFMSRQNELLAYLEEGDSAHLDAIAAEYLQLSVQKKSYDQVRFLNADGMEMVRVNNGQPEPVAADKLQSKRNRYYFNDCYTLERDRVFISPLDLNMEQGRIETPFKPVIRLGTPVFDGGGRKRGIVLLNYLGADLFERLIDSENVSEGQTMLLNGEGYWLLSPDSSQEWGFMFDDAQRSFARHYTDAWTQIQLHRQGQLHSPHGLFTYRTISPLSGGNYATSETSATGTGESGSLQSGSLQSGSMEQRPYHWYLVSHVPKQAIDTIATKILLKLVSFGAGLFLVISSGAWFLAGAITKRRIAQDQLKTLALFDTLTDLPNRRLFHDRLNAAIKQCRRDKKCFGLLFIDLDGFKKINDSFGHEAGDAVLCIVADRLMQCVRESDTVARLGGDEFVVIARNTGTRKDVEVIAMRFNDALSTTIALPQGDARIGGSVGISQFPENSKDGEELLRQADRAMYQAKRNGKNQFSIYSPALDAESG